jgi:hypothetical protein
LPFLAEKVSNMLYTIVKKCSHVDEDDKEVNLSSIMDGEDKDGEE